MLTKYTDPTPPKSFGKDADAYLAETYMMTGATTTIQKINTLKLKMGDVESNFYGFGVVVNDEMKLACLEYEFLEQHGKITLVTA